MTDTKTPKEQPPKERRVAKKAEATQGSQSAALLRSMLKKIGVKPIERPVESFPFTPSGSIVIDHLIGGSKTLDGKGRVCPGYPRRKITEIFGPESSGKTTVALAAAAQVLRDGGSVLYLDFEHAIHHGYAQKIGIDFDCDRWTLAAPDTMEEGFKAIYLALAAGTDLIVVDSVAAMVPKDELEKKVDDTAKVGAVAKKMAETLPKFVLWLAKYPMEGSGESKKSRTNAKGTALVLLNQERATISTGGGGYGTPEPNSSGGKALKFYAYVRLRLQKFSSESIEKKDPMTGKKRKFPYGNVTNVKVVKSKADAKQGHSANIFIRYGYGIDDAYSMIETGISTGIFKRDGAYYSFKDVRLQGRDKFRMFLLGNAAIYAEAKAKIAESIVDQAPTAIADDEITDEDSIMQGMEDDMEDALGAVGGASEEVVVEAETEADSVEDEG